MFRLDINGLRFLAVISVVLFHFEVPFFSGGYAGVDIFFVISGYLMNSILSKNEINIKNSISFYKRRMKRIYPALIICILFFVAIYTFTSPPSAINYLSLQTIAAITFTSNLFFTKVLSNYFSNTAGSYLFLNTWSLGVEFQYYLILPLFLYVVKKIKIRESSLILASIISSFIICLLVVKIKQQVAFFNVPFRAWELLIGAYASSIEGHVKIKKQLKKPIELVCIFSLIVYMVFGGDSSSWPNIKALLPTLLTFLIIITHVENENVLLRWKLPQTIGLWSYSIYLYHWPIASLLINHGLMHGFKVKAISITLSIIAGAISYYLIEKSQSVIINKKSFLIMISCLLIILPTFVTKSGVDKIWISKRDFKLDTYNNYNLADQFSKKIPTAAQTCFLTSGNPDIKYYNYDECTHTTEGKKTILIFGDSHAAEFSKAIREKYKTYNIIQATASGCPPILSSEGVGYCTKLTKLVFDKIIKEKKIDMAIVSADWDDFYYSNDLINGIERTNSLLKKSITTVKFISQTKHFPTNLSTLLIFNKNQQEIIPENDARQVYEKMKSTLHDIDFIDIYNYGCAGGNCRLTDVNDTPMFFDNNHYTYPWTSKIVNDMF